MPFQILRNDITKVKADAIVNTANPRPVIGSGTDSAVYMAAGKEALLKERLKIGEIAPGRAVSTKAFALPARYIIHTVGPIWIDGTSGERDILRLCYRNSLYLAAELFCKSIAFPLIATGVYGFPKDEALQIALSEISRFLLTHDMQVILVVFDRKAFALSGKLLGNIEEYIDELAVSRVQEAEYFGADVESSRLEIRRRRAAPVSDRKCRRLFEDHSDWSFQAPAAFPDVSGKSLDEILEGAGDTFQQRLFSLIDQSGMDDVSVYKKANIDRKVFSRIRCSKDYKPKKKTAVAFAIALELNMPTMLDLLARAEIAFSPSNKFDLIVSYFVTNQVYDIYEINAALFQYGQPILGD